MDDYTFDYDRAADLLNIVEKIATVAPAFTAISGEAMRELKAMNDELTAYAVARAKEERAEADHAAAVAAAEAEEAAAAEAEVVDVPPPNGKTANSRRTV